jgi:rhodanese-related sulfurtransferase
MMTVSPKSIIETSSKLRVSWIRFYRVLLVSLSFLLEAAQAADLEHSLPDQASEPALECSVSGHPVTNPDKDALKSQLLAELNQRELWFVNGDKTRVSGCFADRHASETAMADPGTVVVDVRPATIFADATIAGALNIPANLLKTKTFLRDKPLLLLNDGADYAQLESVCQQLQAIGFANTRVIYGGLQSWWSAGRELTGKATDFSRLDAVTPAVYHANKAYRHWLIVDVSATRVSKRIESLPVGWAFYKDPAAQQKWLEKLAALLALHSKRLGSPPLVLLIDEDGHRTGQLLEYLKQIPQPSKSATAPVHRPVTPVNQKQSPLERWGLSGALLFRLDGGVVGYETFLKKRLQSLAYSPVLTQNRGCGVHR